MSIEPARPYVPNMIQIGGFHVQDAKKLPNDIQSFLDSAEHGAILFTLGSNLKMATVEEQKRQIILKVLGEMAPIKIVLKSEMNHGNVPENIIIREWLPQSDILGEKTKKMF